MRHLTPIATLILIATALPGAEAVPPVASDPASAVAPPAGDADRLLQQLGSPAKLVVKRPDGRLWWQAGDAPQAAAYRIIDIDASGDPRLDTAIGSLPVARRLLAEGRLDVLQLLPQLIEHAVKAGLKADGLRLVEGVITGPHLRSPERVVIVEGVLAKTAVEPRPAGSLVDLAAAAKAAIAVLPASKFDELGKRTIASVLARLERKDGEFDEDIEAGVPSFLRRVVRHGWLRPVLPEQAKAVEEAVRAAERMLPVNRFAGSDASGRPLELCEVRDAFGAGGWTLTTPARSDFARPHVKPMYSGTLPDLHLVVQLPPGADPLALPSDPVQVRLLHGGQAVAQWTREGGLAVNEAGWRQVVPSRGPGFDKDAVADVLPPHLVIGGLNGDVAGLAVPKGLLKPPADASSAESERFLADCAAMLPSAGAVDLVGNYLFMYVYDSPDSRFPLLIGNKEDKGDIHQTAEQTLDTVAGGMVRGDCDDLSELYQRIVERQGHLAHVVSLPQHAALAWARNDLGDGLWHVYVLQTGPGLEFTHKELPEALAKAYKRFDETDAFDPNGLGLLLRFSGENTRSGWRLSWRIFSDAAYARTMIDVQRDWHFQTYQRGIVTMNALIDGGDRDTANFRELSGLYSFTGQYDLAVERHRIAIQQTAEAERTSRFYMRQELIGHMLDAGMTAEADRETADLLDATFPKVGGEIGPAAVQVGFELATVLARRKRPEQAAHALDVLINSTAMPSLFRREPQPLPAQVEELADWVRGPNFSQEKWDRVQQLDHLRSLMQSYAGTAVAVMEAGGRDAIQQGGPVQVSARAVQRWLDDIAFRDLDEPSDVMFRYASAGRYYAAVIGTEQFERLLQDVAQPTGAPPEPGKRVGGLAQLPADLPWIGISVPYWTQRLFDCFDRTRKTPATDAERAAFAANVATLGARVAAAHAACNRLGLINPAFDHQAHLAALVTAMIGKDAKTIAERLDHVREKNDKRLRDDTAQWLGDAARHTDLAWYGQIIGLWEKQVNYKAKWFWIAWRAALTGGADGRAHALLVADRAAANNQDDPAFADEAKFMHTLFDPKPKP
jgi:hypothetical protein